MFFFKLMFLKNKKKTDDKGAALASVLLITTFVMVITSAVLSMAYNTYRMKLINVSSKDNLYACEAVLEQVRVGFRNQFAEITDAYSELTADDIEEAFETFYENYAIEDETIKVDNNYRVGNTDSGKGIYFYDVVKVAELLTSISGTDGASVVVHEDEAYKDLGYEDGTPIFTSWVEITVNDSDYDAITVTLEANATGKNNFELTETYVTFHDLTVIYSENGYESEVTTDITIEFPETGTTVTTTSGTTSGNIAGWVSLEDRLKTYGDWKDVFATNSAIDFGTVVEEMGDDVVYVNTADYPANTVNSVIFDMERFYISGEEGTYSHMPIAPSVTVQDGAGMGKEYAACGGSDRDYSNLYIYVGPEGSEEEDNDDYWVKYTDVFNTYNGFFATSGTSVAAYQAKYGDYLESSNGSVDAQKQVTVTYKVNLLDGNGNYNSRGWILITGSVYGDSGSFVAMPVINANAKMYVNIEYERALPTYYFEYEYNGDDQKGYKDMNYLFVDFSKSNYYVGDILHISLENVNAQAIVDGKDSYMLSISQQVSSVYGVTGTSNGILYPIYTYTNTPYTGECRVEVNSENSSILEIYIDITWDLYPYLNIQYYYGYDGGVSVSMEWLSSDGTGTTTTTTTGTASDAVIYYEDWRKE